MISESSWRGFPDLGYNAEWRVCRGSEVGAPHHRRNRFSWLLTPAASSYKQGESFLIKILGKQDITEAKDV